MNWQECISRGLVIESEVNNNLIEALLQSSEEKIDTADLIELTRKSCSSKILLVYDALIDVLKCISMYKGYQVFNHECFSVFLNEICEEEIFANSFNKYREIRNKISYYGKRVLLSDARFLINEIRLLRLKLLNKYFG
jgi:hypothetical protein